MIYSTITKKKQLSQRHIIPIIKIGMVCFCFFFFMMICLFEGCDFRNNNYTPILRQINNMTENSSDSSKLALDIINKIPVKQLDLKQKMYLYLLHAKAMNKAYIPFTSSDTMECVVKYYEEYGSLKQQSEAYYLLGCTYRDLNKGQKALSCFNMAISKGQQSSKKEIGRIYMQMSEIYNDQNLSRLRLKYIDLACQAMLMAKDTICAMQYYAHKSSTYEDLLMPDSAILVNCKVANFLLKKGMKNEAYLYLGNNFYPYIYKKDYKKAKRAMHLYETYSNMFEEKQIRAGAEVYYNIKGLFYLETGLLDSALFYFKKEEKLGKDFNNQNASAIGLAKLYQRIGKYDLASKYAIKAYEINDSAYNLNTAKMIMQIQSIYDYGNIEKKALQKAYEAKQTKWILLIAIGCFTLILFVLFLLGWLFRNKSRRKLYRSKKLYMDSIAEMHKLKQEIEYLKLNDEKKKEIIRRKKEKKIAVLSSEIEEYEKNISTHQYEIIENDLRSNIICQRFVYLSYHIAKEQPTISEWNNLKELINN